MEEGRVSKRFEPDITHNLVLLLWLLVTIYFKKNV